MIQENPDLENNILYELLIYAEWQQEPEIQGKNNGERAEVNDSDYISKLLGPLARQPCPPLLVRQLNNLQLPWTFAIGGSGAVIAILQDTSLEIRTSRDEYGTIIGKTQVCRDPSPQWRRILWSPDCTMLVCASSSGKLDFYDLIGAYMFTIPSMVSTTQNGTQDYSFAIAGMAFSEARVKNTQWSYEFLAANYLGEIYGFFVNPSGSFQSSHQPFSLSKWYPGGITSFRPLPSLHLLLISGRTSTSSGEEEEAAALRGGLSAWRILSDSPFYKRTLGQQRTCSKSSWKTLLSQYNPYHNSQQDLVFKMSVSPDETILATIHVSGALSLWDLPSLRLKKHWPLEWQPNYAEVNPQSCEPGVKRRVDSPLHFRITDINWWSNDAIIVVRGCGAVTVSSIRSLQNLLGVSPEWFEPSPAVTSFCDGGFLAIESELRVKSKRHAEDLDDGDEEGSSDDEDSSVFAKSYELAQRTLYFITDSDRFQPPKKKIKMLSTTYRLLCLKSTTPEELYSRKIDNEEYGEALALAHTYELDSDLVYQRQWRKMPATVESIHDYLSKIKKRSWVLHECLERVPESCEAARELLHYGLRGTDLEALIAIGTGEDHGRFILSSSLEEDDPNDSVAYASDADDAYEVRKRQSQKRRADLLKQVNFKKLTLEQKQLCQCRLKLLNYLDKLSTYEVILGGPMHVDDHFDPLYFHQFRGQSGVEAALHYARHSNWEAVATLFTYQGAATLPHRLPVLSRFPETTPPAEYQSLLPLYNERESVFYAWDEHQHREPDWCETKHQKNPISDEFVQDFYEKNEDFMKYRESPLTAATVTEWFLERAREMEGRSGLVDNATQLLKIGMQRKIKGLEKLHDAVTILELLVYDIGVMVDLSLREYEGMADSEKVKLIMSTTSKDNFMKHLQQWLLPFLYQCVKYDPSSGKSLFRSYILSISRDDLFYCKKMLENLKCDPPFIIDDFDELVSLTLESVYSCEKTDELKNAHAIYELLLSLPDNFNRNARKLHSLPASVAALKKHICVAGLMDKNGLALPLSSVENISKTKDEIKKVLTKLTRMASHRVPILDEAEWTSLLSDILEMQKVLFKSVTYEDCYEIVLHSLLCSGHTENISFAGRMMECNTKSRRVIGPQSYKLPYQKSVSLVLAASQEYFNSSADGSDPCMALAKSCLNLIEDVPSSIEEEYDLISSISLLQEFNMTILPLQVRLSDNRMAIVEETLKKNARNYKKSQKIMKLANLLRVGNSSSHEREGKVLTLIGEHAFQAKDYNECLSACTQLMAGGHQEGWLICYTLGGCTQFDNIPERSSLMSFALAFCTEDLIETILKSRSELQLQVLQDRVKFLVGDIPLEHSSGDFDNSVVPEEDSLWQAGGRTTLHALQTTTQTAKVVLTSVKSVRFWKDAIKYLSQPSLFFSLLFCSVENTSNKICWIQTTDLPPDGEGESNADLKQQGTCAFFEQLVEGAHISRFEANYQRYARPDLNQTLEISSSILRASLIQDGLKNEASSSTLEDSVLLDVAKSYLPEDTAFGLFILLTLQEVDQAESLFSSLPSSPVVLQLASLFYALKIRTRLKLPLPFTNEMDASAFCKETLGLKESAENRADQCWFLLEKYLKMLHDFVQAEVLHSIGGGVDATRFANDDEYKRDTILGISMTLDENVFSTAISLAQHYNIPVWDLYMTHLEYLFSESSVPASVLCGRLPSLSPHLLPRPRDLGPRLVGRVLPGLGGRDHDKMDACLALAEECGDAEDANRVKASTHRKMLAKFRAAMNTIDYKKVTSPEHCESYLSEILNESNVHVFAKSAHDMPKKGGGFYESSNIYCLWAKKYFFEGTASNSKVPATKTEWLHRFESCSDVLQRLVSGDVLELVDSIVFSEKSLEKMTIDCRSDIVKRLMKLARGRSSKHKHNVLLSREWSDVASVLNSLHSHLHRLEEETWVQMRDSSQDPKVKEYCKEFDLSKSSVEKLQSLLTRIVLEGPDLSLLKTFISCCPGEVGWEPAHAYLKAIEAVLFRMKNPDCSAFSCFESIPPIQALEEILNDIAKEQEELMVEDMAAEKLNEFCQDPEVSVSIRLSILQLLEKTNCISPEYNDLLLLYRTQAVVSSAWPDLHVCEEEVKDVCQRRMLFESLLSLCHSVDQFSSLAKLLDHWPPFSDLDTPQDEPWSQLLCGLARISTKDALTAAVTVLERALECPTFTLECCKGVFEIIKYQNSLLHTLKCALKTGHETLHSEALQHLKEKEVTPTDYDSELLELVLRRRVCAELVSTGLYQPLVEHLLHCQDDIPQESHRSLDAVIGQLHENGHDFEAGSLLLVRDNVHSGLGSFSAAISLLQRWLANKCS